MRTAMPTKIIDLTPYLRQTRQERRRDLAYTVLALWTQYLSLGALLLYGLLRAVGCPEIPPGTYTGPLALLWPLSFFLLLTSYTAYRLLWQEDSP